MSLDVNISEPEEFNCCELHSCVEKVMKLKGVSDFEYHVDYICGKGDNYIANIFRVKINETGNSDNIMNVIVKTLINTARQDLFHELHRREVIVYRDVIPQFKSIQENININERVVFPECLLSNEERGKEVLILRDLKVEGYELDSKIAKHEDLDYAQIRMVLTELAKFHALSFVYQIHNPGRFAEAKLKLEDMMYQEDFLNISKIRKYFLESYEMSLKVLDDMNLKNKLEKLNGKILLILREFTRPKKYNVLCHGDFWINNVLFKHEENYPSKLCILDFQAMRFACPATDIVYFIYISTDSKFRSEHFEVLQSMYYDSLKSFLNLFDIDVETVYPRTEFFEDLKSFLPFGLLSALIELRVATTTPEDDAILHGSMIVSNTDTCEVPGEIHLFKSRVNDVVNESANNGVLDQLLNKNIPK